MTCKETMTAQTPTARIPTPTQTHGAVGRLSGDEEMQQSIYSELLRTPGLDGRGIQVAVLAHGEVTLLGTVPTSHERELALRVARAQAGGRSVRAGLELAPPPSP
jgi:osmotically-inducible protein OsmY